MHVDIFYSARDSAIKGKLQFGTDSINPFYPNVPFLYPQ